MIAGALELHSPSTFRLLDIGKGYSWNGMFPQSKITFASYKADMILGLHTMSSNTELLWLDAELIMNLPGSLKEIQKLTVPMAEAIVSMIDNNEIDAGDISGCRLLSSSGRGRLIRDLAVAGKAIYTKAISRSIEFDGWLYFIRHNCVWKEIVGTGKVRERQVTNFVIEPSEDIIVDNNVTSYFVYVKFDDGQIMPLLIPVSLIDNPVSYLKYIRNESIKQGKPRPSVLLSREAGILPALFDALYVGSPTLSIQHTQGRSKKTLPSAIGLLRIAGMISGEDFIAPSVSERFLSETLIKEIIRTSNLGNMYSIGRGLKMLHGKTVQMEKGEKPGWIIPAKTEMKNI